MLDLDKMRAVAEEALTGSDMFVVELRSAAGNVIELTIDSDSHVAIEDCVALSRAIDAQFDRDVEDYELTVGSAGIGQSLKVLRQYKKLIGRPVEVVLTNGAKIVGELRDATPESITVAYPEKVVVEGSKRKKEIETVREYPLGEVKTTKEYLDFK